ncbi:glycoside hydrolase family 55 protein, partial [Burkholderia glumae]|uniref:glycoside hydrolase family 55 protein n=1 Tax=Burkholderia glumae TaxID=337 RepID=UPI0020373FD7|nr:glycoside hydrolase family 55 protein [Burkholderia glumae]
MTFSTPLAFSSGGTGATTALGATSNLQFQASLSGAGGRSVASKLSDVVSILDFPGCDKTGVADSTACIQAALNSGARTVYVPAGQYRESGLTLPQIQGFTLYGDGPNSILIQTGGSIGYPAISGAFTFDSHSTIRDLKFDGTAGTANTLDTT